MPEPSIWASGYQQDELDQLGASVHDRRKLKHIGNAVLFSTCWLGLTGGVAAWGLADQVATAPRAAIAAVAAFVLAAFVIVFDRLSVYFLDTNKETFGRGAVYGTLRILLVIAIGLLVDIQIMPIVMRPELAHYAVQMREVHERDRFRELNARYNITTRQRNVTNAKEELEAAREALTTVPSPIRSALVSSDRCFANLNSTPRTGTYNRQRSNCVAQRRNARTRLNEYLNSAGEREAQAQRENARTSDDLRSAERDVADRINQSATEAARNVTEANPAVFWELVTTDVGAAIKALCLLILHLCFDLMPFIAKGLSGGTGIGRRISAQLDAERTEAEADRLVVESAALVSVESNRVSAQATIAALTSPSMRAIIAEAAEVQVRTAAPLEQAAAALERAIAAHNKISRMRSRTPQLEALKWGLLANAFAESLQAAAVRPSAGLR